MFSPQPVWFNVLGGRFTNQSQMLLCKNGDTPCFEIVYCKLILYPLSLKTNLVPIRVVLYFCLKLNTMLYYTLTEHSITIQGKLCNLTFCCVFS